MQYSNSFYFCLNLSDKTGKCLYFEKDVFEKYVISWNRARELPHIIGEFGRYLLLISQSLGLNFIPCHWLAKVLSKHVALGIFHMKLTKKKIYESHAYPEKSSFYMLMICSIEWVNVGTKGCQWTDPGCTAPKGTVRPGRMIFDILYPFYIT